MYLRSAYIGLVLTSIGVVGIPGHLTNYRERRVLRRLRASSLSIWNIFGSPAIVSLVTGMVGGILILAAALFAFDMQIPVNPALVFAGFLVSVFCFAAIGMF